MASSFEIRGAGGRLRITILRFERPDSLEYWDANWLNADVMATVRGFSGSCRLNLQARELREFKEGLAAGYRDLAGSTELKALEGHLQLRCEFKRRGTICVWFRLREPMSSPTFLEGTFDTDQSYLPELLRDLGQAAAEFKEVAGHPGDRG